MHEHSAPKTSTTMMLTSTAVTGSASRSSRIGSACATERAASVVAKRDRRLAEAASADRLTSVHAALQRTSVTSSQCGCATTCSAPKALAFGAGRACLNSDRQLADTAKPPDSRKWHALV